MTVVVAAAEMTGTRFRVPVVFPCDVNTSWGDKLMAASVFCARGDPGTCWGGNQQDGGEVAVVHPLHLVTSRLGRRWLVHRAFVMWGRVFDDTLALTPRVVRRAGGRRRACRVRVALALPGVVSVRRRP
jgi:hypothetical protein